MKLTRRQALGAAAAAGIAATGCAPRALGQFTPRPGDEPALRLLNRFGYGPRSDDIEELRKVGAKAWLDKQLAAPSDDPLFLVAKLRGLEIFHFAAWELRDFYPEVIMFQLRKASLLRAVYSPWQLRERAVDFWSDHFNIYAGKALAVYRKPTDDKEVIRANALGSFPAMLRASAKSTAMLVYLDQQNSHYGQPNENYARELLELHTLGVNGGYTQKDVMEVARCFTGWTEERRFLRPKGSFRFRQDLHDDGEKIVLGKKIPAGGGVEDGEMVLDILVRHPSTARHLAKKMCAFFLGESGQSAEADVAWTYRETGGDIQAMLRAVYKSDAFTNGEPVCKRPREFAIGAIRAMGADTDAGEGLQEAIRLMGQPTFGWAMPDGYPIEPQAWSASMLARWNFAIGLAHNEVGNTPVSADGLDLNSAITSVYKMPAEHKSLRKLRTALAGLGEQSEELLAMCIAAPEYQWR